ncbi:DUF2284 domain-containing protein [Sporomusa sp.]|uniref:DUF2284 domain-containing protein n=1 Tax=Sporomusa sp. TaxID=2078658 RepID=UPI002C8891EF|nr:DUF2284 domain-containing protein [Sporomusa sp.]HWR44145.1 DUF2284 domain-containing protein [Sporomusa sp.]
MYHTTTSINSEHLHEFISKYQHQEKFMAFCKDCHNYNTLWSCPPLQFDANQFLLDFNYIYIIGAKVIYDAETIELANTSDKIKEITTQSLREVKNKLSDILLDLERQIPDSISLASGGCHICERCRRCDNLPCQYPEKMRYSLDSFGFDLTAITSDMLQIELKWSKDSLPEYYTLIHALLTKQSLGNMLENIII